MRDLEIIRARIQRHESSSLSSVGVWRDAAWLVAEADRLAARANENLDKAIANRIEADRLRDALVAIRRDPSLGRTLVEYLDGVLGKPLPPGRTRKWMRMGRINHLVPNYTGSDYTCSSECGYIGATRRDDSRFDCKLCRAIAINMRIEVHA